MLSNKRLSSIFVTILVVFFVTLAINSPQPIRAQSDPSGWSQPVNLSKSGAASQPRIVAAQTGTMQAFWMDRFDGLTSAVYNGQSWSAARPTPLPRQAQIMPFIIADGSGWVHAFWQETSGRNFPVNSLYHSQMPIGGQSWTNPELVAEDALVYSVYAPANQGLSLAYIRQVNTDVAPAGVYVRRLETGGVYFGLSTPVYNSIYFRLAVPGNTNLNVADDGTGNIHLVWKDPNQSQILYSFSRDNGLSWSPPAYFGDGQDQISNPHLGAMPGIALGIWQDVASGPCSLYQQNWAPPPGTATQVETLSTPTLGEAPPTATPAQEATLTTTDLTPQATSVPPLDSSVLQTAVPIENNSTGWGVAQPIFQDLVACPTADSFLPKPDNNLLLWLWDEGTSNLRLSGWNSERNEWSLIQNINVQFEDPGSGKLSILGDLHATFADDKLAVTGIDSGGEVWATISQQGVGDLVYAPPPLWIPIQPIVPAAQSIANPALVMDRVDRAHLVWTQPSNLGVLDAPIIYSYWEPSNPANDQLQVNQVILFPGSPKEIARQPALFVDEPSSLLHMVWSGSEQGEILYSKAPLDSADSSGEWFSPRTISGQPFASWPQIGADSKNDLFVVYAVSINEGRGIYLVKSEDQGENWSQPIKAFDAIAAGVPAVDHPTLAVSPDGNLYIAWVETTPEGSEIPQATSYSFSKDGGVTWSKRVTLAGEGHDWPKLMVVNDLLHIFYAQLDGTGGIVWHSNIPIAEMKIDDENTWGLPTRLPGWEQVSLPFGVTQSGVSSQAVIHLVGVSSTNENFYYSTFSNNAWIPAEFFKLAGMKSPGNGLQAATSPEGGWLAITWLAVPQTDKSDEPTFFFSARSIPPVEAPILPTIQPSSTPTLAVSPTPTLFLPTPTPNLNQKPPPDSAAASPVLLAAILAGLVILGLFIWRIAISRRRL